MRTMILALIATLGYSSLSVAQDIVPAREPLWLPGVRNTYFSRTRAYEVTIQSESGVVAVIDIQKGVFLSVHYSIEKNPSDGEDLQKEVLRTFQGDIILRIRRADEIEENESRATSDIMAKAPLEMTLDNVVVVVKEIGLPDRESESGR